MQLDHSTNTPGLVQPHTEMYSSSNGGGGRLGVISNQPRSICLSLKSFGHVDARQSCTLLTELNTLPRSKKLLDSRLLRARQKRSKAVVPRQFGHELDIQCRLAAALVNESMAPRVRLVTP